MNIQELDHKLEKAIAEYLREEMEAKIKLDSKLNALRRNAVSAGGDFMASHTMVELFRSRVFR